MNKASTNQISSLLYFLVCSSFLGISINNLLKNTKQDSVLIILLSMIIGFFFILLLFKINDYEPDLNGAQKIVKYFGKFWGKVINFLTFLIVYLLVITDYWNLVFFISSQYLHKTPTLFIGSIFSFALIYLLTKPRKVIYRVVFFFSAIVISLFSFSLFGLIFKVNLNNLYPMFTSSNYRIFLGIKSFISFNILPIFITLTIPKNSILDNKLYKKKVVVVYLISCISLLFVMLCTCTIFGVELAMIYQYPEFHILKELSIFESNTRAESILALQWVIDLFMFITIGLLYLQDIAFSFFNKKNDKIIIALIAFQLLLIELVFNNTSKIYNFIYKYLPNLIFYPFIGLIIIIIMKKVIKKIDKIHYQSY